MVWAIFNIIIGLLINPSLAVVIALVLTLLPITFCFFFGNKIFLIAAKSFKFRDNNQLKSMIDNISCRLGMRTPEIYYSPYLATNFYAASSVMGDCIIIGGRVEYKLSPTEKYNALENLLVAIKSKQVARITFISSLHMFFEVPSWFFRKVLRLPLLSVIYRTFLFSIFLVKDYIINSYRILNNEVLSKNPEEFSFYFKLLPYKMKQGYFFEPMLRDLALVTPPKSGIQDHMLGNFEGLNSIMIKKLLGSK